MRRRQRLDEAALPTAVDEHGNTMPSTFSFQGRTKEREPESSIFVPGKDGLIQNTPLQDFLEIVFADGFRGQVVVNDLGPHPDAIPYGERTTKTRDYPPNNCQICGAIL